MANKNIAKGEKPYIFPCGRFHMSDCENPRFTERTSTNLGRSHRLPHVCTIMIYGKLGGYRLQETAAFIYIYMWWTMNNMWYLGIANVDIREYDDITWKGVSLIWEGPIAYLVFLTISINFHKPMSVEYIFSIAGVFTVAHMNQTYLDLCDINIYCIFAMVQNLRSLFCLFQLLTHLHEG